MKKTTLITLGASALALLLIVPLAFAGPGRRGGWGDGPGFGGKRGERIAELLGLDAKQKAELDALREDMRTDVADIQVQIKAKHDALKVLWTAPTPDRAKIVAAHKEIGALQQQVAEARIDFMFAAKGVLTADQFKKFVELKGPRGGMGPGGFKGHRGGRGGGGCPFGGPGGGPGGGAGMGPGPGFDPDLGDEPDADDVR